MSNHNRGQNTFTAIAGEHFVAGELSKRGWIATLTAKNTPGVDVLATIGDKFVRIDVKTAAGGIRAPG
jgi:PhoPQ-activated pathogenicity-related protein